jgi:hypothetical protein
VARAPRPSGALPLLLSFLASIRNRTAPSPIRGRWGVALPSPEHEALVRLLRDRPSLAARLLALATDADVLPAFHDARVGEGAITEERAVEYRADLVIELHDWRGRPVAGVIAEVQLRRDKRKRFTWPYYVAALRARLQAPVHLLVVARARVLGCTDIAQLEGWIARAAHVTSAEALFGRD